MRAPTLLAFAFLAAAPAAGQEPGPSPSPSPSPPPPAPIVGRFSPTFALRVGGPLLASASAGFIRGPRRQEPDGCPSASGLLVQVEAGVGGGRLDVGPAFTFCYTPFGSLGAGAFTASVLRTWGRPLGAEAGRTYVGGELDIGLADWSLGFGLLKRVAGTEGGGWLFTWNVGKGF